MTQITVLRPIVIASIAAALAVVACSSSTDNAGASSSTSSTSSSGGDTSGCKTGKNAAWATPAGAPFVLPSGVSLQNGTITGIDDVNCPIDMAFEEYGNEGLFVCIGFTNASGSASSVTLPAGLTYIAKTQSTYNGITLQEHILPLPAGTTYFKLAPFSINQKCVFDSKDDLFVFGNVSSDAGIAELIGLAKDKDLSTPVTDAASALRLGVFDVTDGDGLTADHRTAIEQATD